MSHGHHLHFIGVYLTGVHLMGVYLINVHLTGVYLIPSSGGNTLFSAKCGSRHFPSKFGAGFPASQAYIRAHHPPKPAIPAPYPCVFGGGWQLNFSGLFTPRIIFRAKKRISPRQRDRRAPHGRTSHGRHRRVLYRRVYVSKSKKAIGKTSRSPTLPNGDRASGHPNCAPNLQHFSSR
jgi:hypothetical protein